MIRALVLLMLLTAIPCFAIDYSPELLRDELVETTLIDVSKQYPEPAANHYYDLVINKDIYQKEYYIPLNMQDKIVQLHMRNVNSVYPESNLKYDYTKVKYFPLRIKFLQTITTKGNENSEGQIVKFVVVSDMYDGKKKILQHGTIGTARIETISPRGFMGVPADLIISHFEVEGLDKKKIEGDVVKSGYNLMGLAGALKYSIGTFIPGTGYLFMLIKGGQAKIETSDIFEVKYVP